MDKYTMLLVLARHFPGASVNTIIAAVNDLSGEVDLTPHDRLVNTALATPDVIVALQQGKKINAIKALRVATNASLLEAKNAIEDKRLDGFYVHP
jgi:ribosomal protein L7/L12